MQEETSSYRQLSEEDEELRFQKKKRCHNCKKLIAHNATLCYFCGEEADAGSFKKPLWVVWTALVLIAVLGIFFLFF
jgi:RNA polymerase subunit RPABC4/transcription elongation factor Spt4